MTPFLTGCHANQLLIQPDWLETPSSDNQSRTASPVRAGWKRQPVPTSPPADQLAGGPSPPRGTVPTRSDFEKYPITKEEEFKENPMIASETPRTPCGGRHRTGLEYSRCMAFYTPDAEKGRWAVVFHCYRAKVWTYPTLEEAENYLAFVRGHYLNCGWHCARDHVVIDTKTQTLIDTKEMNR